MKPLPAPPEARHIMLGSRANWVAVHGGDHHRRFPEYPDQSLEDWHRQRGFHEES